MKNIREDGTASENLALNYCVPIYLMFRRAVLTVREW